MPTEVPDTPEFTAELAERLMREAGRRRRVRRPFATHALRRLRSVSSTAAHATLAVVLSTTILMMSPSTVHREATLPPIARAPRYGYLAQFGVPPDQGIDRTVTLARESGFEVEVISTYVPYRGADGEIVEMRHMATPVTTVPVEEQPRGPLLIVIGFSVGYGDNTAN